MQPSANLACSAIEHSMSELRDACAWLWRILDDRSRCHFCSCWQGLNLRFLSTDNPVLAGKHRGRLLVEKDGCLRLKVEWDDPFGGTGHEIFRLVTPTELHAHSHLSVGGRTVDYLTVYRRK
jgi:hypothetical protein